MTASKDAKKIGLKGLMRVSQETGQSMQTLINWHKNKPKLFNTVLFGCKAIDEIKVLADMVYDDEYEVARTLAISNRLKELVQFDTHYVNDRAVNNCANMEDHMAKSCECGSVNFALLKSGKVECNKCGEIHKINWIDN
tara:strand:+ start:752 stop:1168 length:417 start_codon:yes stop_codon:yes gene_type:complete